MKALETPFETLIGLERSTLHPAGIGMHPRDGIEACCRATEAKDLTGRSRGSGLAVVLHTSAFSGPPGNLASSIHLEHSPCLCWQIFSQNPIH